jgi:UDP:flavonoid glycosyltransferase YjiC (YdhE family)
LQGSSEAPPLTLTYSANSIKWGPEIDIAGFVFLDLASSFKPPAELVKFLGAGDSPVYIGFGSIVVDDPEKFTKMIFEAIKRAGVRALVSKGWGGFGDDNPPENVYMVRLLLT